jgi:acyl-coenzyme A thioesterase PaaI-like protein
MKAGPKLASLFAGHPAAASHSQPHIGQTRLTTKLHSLFLRPRQSGRLLLIAARCHPGAP